MRRLGGWLHSPAGLGGTDDMLSTVQGFLLAMVLALLATSADGREGRYFWRVQRLPQLREPVPVPDDVPRPATLTGNRENRDDLYPNARHFLWRKRRDRHGGVQQCRGLRGGQDDRREGGGFRQPAAHGDRNVHVQRIGGIRGDNHRHWED